jgi:tRNA pseudouridine38-40 synthase
MKNIKLLIQYVGIHYHGWQRQSHVPTLQGTIEECIAKISRERITLIGAGRTDAGVHALGQVANFKTRARLTLESWTNALNALLPRDIVILGAQEVKESFHARRGAKSKIYQYRILNQRIPSAFLDPVTWHFKLPLKIRRMQIAGQSLLGSHDFTSFCGKSAGARTTRSHLMSLTVQRRHHLVLITLKGRNFLQYMARNIVGTLVQIGIGKIPPHQMPDILQAKERRLAGPTAPPQGLFLVQVDY